VRHIGVPGLRPSDSVSCITPPSRAGLFTAGPSALLTARCSPCEMAKLKGEASFPYAITFCMPKGHRDYA
jgi:hypothetical protein